MMRGYLLDVLNWNYTVFIFDDSILNPFPSLIFIRYPGLCSQSDYWMICLEPWGHKYWQNISVHFCIAKLAYMHICNLYNQLQLIGECYRVFIKYCVFSKILIYFPDSVFSHVSMCTHARQVEHQRCSRTGRVQKIQKI